MRFRSCALTVAFTLPMAMGMSGGTFAAGTPTERLRVF